MHCSKKDIARWNRAKRLQKASLTADQNRKVKTLISPAPFDSNSKTVRVVKADGTVRLVERSLA
jgi:hypothetical protein